ncbi:hypothetical protein Taro_034328 [Colocasia esculenta]|uniref:Uncharacterized protein n=1 Tax=Colocasia esculenta TaxID=4460 RepID=A0A843W3S0_COLES|nr:hypothetical protein [Colocasia esculenta]
MGRDMTCGSGTENATGAEKDRDRTGTEIATAYLSCPECDKWTVATRPRRRHIGLSRSGGLRLALTGIRPGLGLWANMNQIDTGHVVLGVCPSTMCTAMVCVIFLDTLTPVFELELGPESLKVPGMDLQSCGLQGRVEELLVAEELWNDHKKLIFFPVRLLRPAQTTFLESS